MFCSEPPGPAEPLYDYLWEPIPGATSYTVVSPSEDVAVIVTEMPTSEPSVEIDWNGSMNTDSIAVFASNDCGNSDTTYFKVNCEFLRIRSNANSNSNDLESMIKVFPNPTNGTFIVQYKIRSERGLLIIRNTLGQILQSHQIEGRSNQREFDVSSLSDGLVEWLIFDGENFTAKGLLSIMK